MLPNFRKSEPDAARVHPSLATSEATSSFPSRSIFPARSQERAVLSIIGPDVVIKGNLVSKGEVQVEGTVQGDIHGSHIVVGQGANITGGIVAEEVVIRGHVSGSVRGRRVMLQASSQVDGDIFHNALSIEQGAMFEGKSRRTNDDPRAGATLSEPPPMPRMLAQIPAPPSAVVALEAANEEEASVTIVPPRLPGTN